MEQITQSLLKDNGDIGEKSCLNWGQRGNRERDEAYIRISKEHQDSGFFPGKGIPFTVKTKDGEEFKCVREQDNGKALTTMGDKSALGIYFRDRLDIQKDARVETSDLENYGRTDVTFTKIDDETYLLDFEPPID